MNKNNKIYKDEKQLINDCLDNNRVAQEHLYRLYADKMFAVCKHYANDRTQACEFLQNGFITVFNKLENFKFNGSFEGWIRRIFVTTALMELRKKKMFFEKIEEIEFGFEDENEPIIDNNIPESKIIKLVNELPQKASVILKLYAIEGYTHQEIAETLDISIGTSKSQLNRARFMIKESLKK